MKKLNKRVFLLVFLCCLLCGCEQHARRAEQDDVEMIRRVEDDFLAAHSFKDGAKLAEFYTDDALLIPPNEPVIQGKKAIAEWYQEEFKKAPPIENPTVVLEEINVSGNAAFIRGIFTLKFKDDDGIRVENLRFISIWYRQKNSSWLFYCDIWNTNASPAITQ